MKHFQNLKISIMKVIHGKLLEQNLYQVMNERDSRKRRSAMERIYTPDATFFEVDEVATGYDELNAIIESIVQKMPGDFIFHTTQPVSENHDVGRLSWGAGPVNGPDAVTGTDIALFKDGRIRSLYVFLDKSGG
jgi:hypothetical protein